MTSVTVAAAPATTEWLEDGDTLTTFHNVSLLLYGNLVSSPTMVRAVDGALGVRVSGRIIPVRPNGLTRPPEVQKARPSPYKPDPEWLAGVQHLKNQAVHERNAVLERSATPAALELENAVASVYRASPLVERVKVKDGLVKVFFAPNTMGVTSFGHFVTPNPPVSSVEQAAQRKKRSDWARYALWHILMQDADHGTVIVISDGGRVAGSVPIDKLGQITAEIDEARILLVHAGLKEAFKLWPDGKVLSPDRAWEAAHPIPLF
jgi:hypothetical protein